MALDAIHSMGKQLGVDAGRGIGYGKLLGAALTAFCVAAATLLLQLVQTRIYSVAYWNHVVYFIISIALLGFGISGTWLSFGDTSRLARRLSVPVAAMGFFITTILSCLALPQFGVNTATVATQNWDQYKLFLTYGCAVLPYFFSGWILGKIYRDFAQHMSFLYFADLIGAALGCFAFLGLIRPWGAVSLVALAGGLVVFPVTALNLRSRVAVYGALLSAASVYGLIAFREEISSSIKPEATKALSALYTPPYILREAERYVEFSEWNPISRIDVVASVQHPKQRRVFIDGDAWTSLFVDVETPLQTWNPDTECMITWASPYLLIPNPESVLVIGSGGGVDVLNALRAQARDIDAVEINPTTARIVVDEYADQTKAIFGRPEVKVYAEEGRSFIRHSNKNYDVIVMNAIDTFAALSSGAYVLSESYLYTVEAIKEYVTHLNPGGILNISRWKTPAESVRLFTVMLEAMHELGYADPEAHIVATFNPLNGFIGVMASNAPFSAKQLETIEEHCERNELQMMFPVEEDKIEYAVQRTYGRYAKLRRSGEQDKALELFDFDARPVWDDSPFFFNFLSLKKLTQGRYSSSPAQILRGNRASLTLFTLLASLTVAVLLFMLLPLARRGKLRIQRSRSWLLYFLCLGVSFIFVEIALMQRFALLLGHPARSLALVLATLLLFAGIGSHLRPLLRLPLGIALGGLVATILVAAFLYPSLIRMSLGLPLWQRGIVTALLIAPLGFFMGMPFPEGIRLVSTHNRDAVPWMWGVNGGATVLGSVLAIILAMATNFTTVFVLAALGYSIALLLQTRFSEQDTAIPAALMPVSADPDFRP